MTKTEFDQMCASARDTTPRLWYAYYLGCLQAGFNEQQAFSLVQTYILSTGVARIQPGTAHGDVKEDE